MENILTLGKLLSLWFCFLLHSILFLISQTSYHTYKIISSYELARPVMGTIFLVNHSFKSKYYVTLFEKIDNLPQIIHITGNESQNDVVIASVHSDRPHLKKLVMMIIIIIIIIVIMNKSQETMAFSCR